MRYSIRAMPPRGAERRFRAGRSWGKEPTIVEVVDNPAPPRKERDRDGREILVYSNQIGVKELAALQADAHFAVSPVGADGIDVDEVAALKLSYVRLGEELTEARRDLAQFAEQIKSLRAQSAQEAEAAGAKVARLQHELDQARAQLGVAQLESRSSATEPTQPAKKGEKK